MGVTKDYVISEAVEKYLRRIPHYIPFEFIALPDVRTSRNTTEEKQKESEGECFLNRITPADYVVLLDERGKEFTSREFSAFIMRKTSEVAKNLVFIIGGPYGFSKKMYDRADSMISLSKMTFPHELIRLFIAEQIYRAMTISRGEPYHHD